MVLCMVNAQKQGYKPVIIDTEGGCDGDFCKDGDWIQVMFTMSIHLGLMRLHLY
jgi:hypothetical protein